MKSNRQSSRHIWKNNIYLLKLCFRTAPGYVIYFMADRVRHSICVFLEFTIGFNFILECVEFGKPFKDVAIFIAFLSCLVFLGFLFGSYLTNKVEPKSLLKIKMRLKEELYTKAKEIDLERYDDPEFYNDYILAISESDKQIDRLFALLDKIGIGITGIALSSGFILATDSISFIFIAVSFTAILFAGKLVTKLEFKIRNKKNPLERRLNYLNRIFYLNDYAKEIRINTEVSKELLKDFDKTCDDILIIDKKNATKRFGLLFLKDYLFNNFIFDVLYISYLAYKAAVLRQLSFGNVAVLYGTAPGVKRRLGYLAEVPPLAQEISLYMDKILNFINAKPQITSQANRLVPITPTEIELKNVSFGYNQEDGYVLHNINMKINPFSKIAIVGYNGAGKTTLTKLILRLYDPDEGEIFLNGINIKEYDIADYRQKIGVVFQDFKIFAATVKENVLLDFADNGSDEAVRFALEKSGFFANNDAALYGLNTNLTTEFEEDGINLSGGEGQKVAVARVFYANANLIMLDEPSSALDPLAEYHLNDSMLRAAKNKSVLFISHRLSTTRIADKIYMLENGKIIEEGTHNELLSGNGKYAEMWNVQSINYIG